MKKSNMLPPKPTYEELEQQNIQLRNKAELELEAINEELIKAKEKAEKSGEEYQLIFENMSSGVAYHKIITDKSGKPIDYIFLDINDNFEKLTGLPRKELINKSVRDVMPNIENDPADWIGRYGKVALHGENMNFESYSEPLNRWYHVKAYSPKKYFFVTLFDDITEMKHKREELYESNKQLDETSKMAKVGGWEIDSLGNTTSWTSESYSIHEMSEGSMPNVTNSIQFYHPDDQQMVNDCVQQAIEKGESFDFEARLITAKNNLKWVRVSGKTVSSGGENISIHGMIQDITEQKLADDALIKNQYYLSKAQEIGSIGTWELDIPNNKLYWTKQNYKNFGLEHGTKLTYEIFLNCIHPDDKDYVNREWEAALDGNPYDIEHRVVADGKVTWLREKADVKFDKNGKAISAIGLTQDITSFKESELKLKESESKFRILADNTNDWEYWINENNEYVFVSPSCEQITGYSKEDFYKNPDLFLDLVREDYKDEVFNHYHDEVRTKPLYTSEFPIINKNNIEIWIEHSCIPIFDEDGRFLGRRGNNRDITDKKESEIKLIKAESIQQKMISNIGDVIVIIDENGINRYKSPNVKKHFGWEVDDLVGISTWDKIHPEDVDGSKKILSSLASEPNKTVTTEIRYLHKNGEYRCIQITILNLLLDPEINGFLCNYHDITERKKYERELRNTKNLLEGNNKLLKKIADNYPNSFVSIIEKDLTIGFNGGQEFTKSNLNPDDFFGLSIQDVFKDKASEVKGYYLKTFAGEETTFELFINNQYQLYKTVPLYNEENEINQILVVVENITERKESQHIIQHQASLIEQVDSAIITIDFNNIILSWNGHAEKLYQWTETEAIGKSIIELLAPKEFIGETKQNFDDLNRDGHWEGEYYVLRKDGTTIPAHITNTYLKDEHGNNIGFIGISTDITKRVQYERDLVETKENLQNTFDLSPSIIAKANLNTEYFIEANQAVTRILGYSIDEFISIPITEFIHPSDHQKTTNEGDRQLTGKEVNYFENRYLCKDGSYKWLAWYGTKADENGVVTIIGSDINTRKSIEQEIAKTTQLLKASQSIAKVGGWEFDINKEELFWTAETYRIHDTSPEEFNPTVDAGVGYFLPESRRVISEALQAAIEHGKGYDLILETFTTKGRRIDVRTTCEVTLQDGSPAKLTGIFQDITEQKLIQSDLVKAKEKAEKSEEQLKLTLEATKDGIWDWDIVKNEVFYSEAWKAILEIETVETKFEIWETRIHPDDKEIVFQTLNQHLAGQSKKWDCNHRLKIGINQWKWVKGRGMVVEKDDEGEPKRMVGTMTDIELQKKYEQELVDAKEKAEESDILKSAFLANMSHEIRTPMNGIIGFSNLLKKPELTSNQKDRYIDLILKSGDRMLNTINDIISISKIESGQMEVVNEELEIGELIHYLYDFFMPEAIGKGLEFKFELTSNLKKLSINTDKEKVYGVLINLVKNAIKFTEFGFIEFGVYEKDKSIEFYVKDSGVGIPKERQSAIFDRFIQADISDKLAKQGSGLGLAISKAYAELLNGELWVESVENKGSTFFFTIPKIATQLDKNELQSEIEDSIDNEKSKLKILIVEDDETSKILLSITVEEISEHIIYAHSGEEAIEKCKNNPDIDIVFMDIQLPIMNGYEATQRIREFNKDVFIIAQTAYALEEDKEKALAAGCNHYISKPIHADNLLDFFESRF